VAAGRGVEPMARRGRKQAQINYAMLGRWLDPIGGKLRTIWRSSLCWLDRGRCLSAQSRRWISGLVNPALRRSRDQPGQAA
jgi:hypothetical protein